LPKWFGLRSNGMVLNILLFGTLIGQWFLWKVKVFNNCFFFHSHFIGQYADGVCTWQLLDLLPWNDHLV
jgi:hypothetical protein